MIELLISLAMITSVAAVTPLLVKVINTSEMDTKGAALEETEMFYNDMGREIRSAQEVNVIGNQLVLTGKSGETAVFSWYQNKVRKQVNGTGHEIWLQDAASFSSVLSGKVLVLKVSDKTGKTTSRSYHVLQGGL